MKIPHITHYSRPTILTNLRGSFTRVASFSVALCIGAFSCAGIPCELSAQDQNSVQGIAGYSDKLSRDPILTVGTTKESNGNVKILVDAAIPNRQFEKFPIRFDFFVNRVFVTSQMRSPELPGPIGIDVTPSIATPPFNYTVIATLLHPNRQYTSVLQSAVYLSDLTFAATCTFLYKSGDGAERNYTLSDVTISQAGEESVSLSLVNARSEDDSVSASLTGTLAIANGSTASGVLSVDGPGGDAEAIAVTGSITKTDGAVTKLGVKSANGGFLLECE
jgi:hypothetical protein